MTPLVLRMVHTKNPPVLGMWVYWDGHRRLEPVDAAIHSLSMKRWLSFAEEKREGADEP